MSIFIINAVEVSADKHQLWVFYFGLFYQSTQEQQTDRHVVVQHSNMILQLKLKRYLRKPEQALQSSDSNDFFLKTIYGSKNWKHYEVPLFLFWSH